MRRLVFLANRKLGNRRFSDKMDLNKGREAGIERWRKF